MCNKRAGKHQIHKEKEQGYDERSVGYVCVCVCGGGGGSEKNKADRYSSVCVTVLYNRKKSQ